MRIVQGFVLSASLLCGMWAEGATAQVSNSSQPSAIGFVGWDATQLNTPDVTVTSVIQQAVSDHSSGIPVGLHLMLGTPQGVLDVSVGPYLSQETKQALAAGQQVRVTGRIVTVSGQNYLLAKQLLINGQQITIRTDHGSLVRTRKQARACSQTLQNGDLQ